MRHIIFNLDHESIVYRVFASNFFKTNNPIAWEKCDDIEQIDKYNDISYIDDST